MQCSCKPRFSSNRSTSYAGWVGIFDMPILSRLKLRFYLRFNWRPFEALSVLTLSVIYKHQCLITITSVDSNMETNELDFGSSVLLIESYFSFKYASKFCKVSIYQCFHLLFATLSNFKTKIMKFELAEYWILKYWIPVLCIMRGWRPALSCFSSSHKQRFIIVLFTNFSFLESRNMSFWNNPCKFKTPSVDVLNLIDPLECYIEYCNTSNL